MIGQSAAGQGHEIFNLTEKVIIKSLFLLSILLYNIFNFKELLYKQKIGMELLEVANIISPGISRWEKSLTKKFGHEIT